MKRHLISYFTAFLNRRSLIDKLFTGPVKPYLKEIKGEVHAVYTELLFLPQVSKRRLFHELIKGVQRLNNSKLAQIIASDEHLGKITVKGAQAFAVHGADYTLAYTLQLSCSNQQLKYCFKSLQVLVSDNVLPLSYFINTCMASSQLMVEDLAAPENVNQYKLLLAVNCLQQVDLVCNQIIQHIKQDVFVLTQKNAPSARPVLSHWPRSRRRRFFPLLARLLVKPV